MLLRVSLIACTSRCVYQRNGYCRLDKAASCGVPTKQDPCVNFIPRSQDGGQCLPDISHTDEL